MDEVMKAMLKSPEDRKAQYIAKLEHENYIQFHSARYAKQEVTRLEAKLAERDALLDELWKMGKDLKTDKDIRDLGQNMRNRIREFSKSATPENADESLRNMVDFCTPMVTEKDDANT